MSQKTFDRATAVIFFGLVAVLTLSFAAKPAIESAGKPMIRLLDALVQASDAKLKVQPDNPEDATHELGVQDLSAQRSMAFAAWLMLGTATAQIVIGIAGVYFVRKTLVETQRSVQAAEDGVRAMREVSDEENRPWLSISSVRMEKCGYEELHAGGMAQYFNIICVVKNHGHSPASNVGLRVWCFLRELSEDDEVRRVCERWREDLSEVDNQGEAIFPGESRQMSHTIAISDADIQLARGVRLSRNPASSIPDMFSPTVFICISYRSNRFQGARMTKSEFVMVEPGTEGRVYVVKSLNHNVALASAFRMNAD